MKSTLSKLVLLNIVLLVMFGVLNAQIGSKYSFGQATAIWQPIWGDYVTDAMTDEGISTPIDIGFSFPYGSNTYTQVKISSNGWLNLGTNLNNPYYNNTNIISTIDIRPVVAPLWDDLDMSVGAVQYSSSGAEPHRLFIVQWLAAQWTAEGTNEYNFMTRLHETGQIDMIYGPHTGSPYNASATIGINMIPGGSGNYFSIVPGLPAQAYSTNSYHNLQVSNPSGTLYIFAPRTTHSQNASAVNLTGNSTPMNNVATEFLATFGNAGVNFTQSGSFTGYLMRGEEVLTYVNIPSIQPSGFSTIPISWTPDTTGVMVLHIQASLIDDPDYLNNTSLPFIIDVQPYTGNNDQTITPSAGLIACYPNPFNTETTISYSVKQPTHVKIEIYNLKGQKLKTLTDDKKTAGNYITQWNGTDDKRKAVSKGTYICKLISGGYTDSKMLFMK